MSNGISFNQFFNGYKNFMGNPMQMLAKRMNIPQNIGNDPNAIIQHLMNSGQIQNNPQFQQSMQQFYGKQK